MPQFEMFAGRRAVMVVIVALFSLLLPVLAMAEGVDCTHANAQESAGGVKDLLSGGKDRVFGRTCKVRYWFRCGELFFPLSLSFSNEGIVQLSIRAYHLPPQHF